MIGSLEPSPRYVVQLGPPPPGSPHGYVPGGRYRTQLTLPVVVTREQVEAIAGHLHDAGSLSVAATLLPSIIYVSHRFTEAHPPPQELNEDLDIIRVLLHHFLFNEFGINMTCVVFEGPGDSTPPE